LAQDKVHKLTTRLQGLDSLRGMAALAVVLYHYTFGYTQVVGKHMPGLDLIATDGHFGIYLFFIISGFVIFMTLERSARAADFSVSRFARLWPPYLVCAGLTSLLIVGLDFNPNHLTLGDAVLNVLMMNKVIGNVSIDLKIKRIEWACLAWLGLAFVARVSSFDQHHQRLGVLLGVDFCHFFVLGMMIYLTSQRRNSWLTMSTAILAFAMTLFGPSWNPGAIKLWQFMLLTALFAVVVWLVAERKIRFLNVAPLLFLGEISYSLYLVHQIAGYYVIR
jgi:peptidoglycan/LPS O-acetylase OafA/YrhL